MNFDESYFKNINYVNYLNRYEKYKKTADELDFYFKNLGIVKKNSKILDYGCAVGFLIKALNQNGYNKVYGYDISKWATNYANKKNNCKIIKKFLKKYDLGIFLDVLEHMTNKNISKLFKEVSFDKLIVRIPCSESEKGKFYLKISRNDNTHINCKSKKEWISFFKKKGFKHFLKLNMNTIYNSKGCMCYFIFK